jgi:hypothetical protein
LIPTFPKGSAKTSVGSFNITILLNIFTETVEDQLEAKVPTTVRSETEIRRLLAGFNHLSLLERVTKQKA